MKIIYRSFDGKEFSTEKKCLEYEKSLDFVMYNPDGRTDDVEQCFVVDIKGPEAVVNFLETCATMEVGSDGINCDCPGVYLWNFSDSRYFLLEPLTFNALKQYIKDTETQE